jgi:hypothetical protein
MFHAATCSACLKADGRPRPPHRNGSTAVATRVPPTLPPSPPSGHAAVAARQAPPPQDAGRSPHTPAALASRRPAAACKAPAAGARAPSGQQQHARTLPEGLPHGFPSGPLPMRMRMHYFRPGELPAGTRHPHRWGRRSLAPGRRPAAAGAAVCKRAQWMPRVPHLHPTSFCRLTGARRLQG